MSGAEINVGDGIDDPGERQPTGREHRSAADGLFAAALARGDPSKLRSRRLVQAFGIELVRFCRQVAERAVEFDPEPCAGDVDNPIVRSDDTGENAHLSPRPIGGVFTKDRGFVRVDSDGRCRCGSGKGRHVHRVLPRDLSRLEMEIIQARPRVRRSTPKQSRQSNTAVTRSEPRLSRFFILGCDEAQPAFASHATYGVSMVAEAEFRVILKDSEPRSSPTDFRSAVNFLN